MENNPDWYRVSNIAGIDSPALIVFPDRVKENIQTAIRMTGDVHGCAHISKRINHRMWCS